MERVELLMREYETITTQIVHWDSLFWHTSQFFLAVESILLAVIGQRLSTELVDNKPMHLGLFFVLVAVAVFNLFLNYVWFRANRRNREYLDVRFGRALQIEDDPEMKDVVQLYHLQQSMLRKPGYAKHRSGPWEIHLPTAFMLTWIASLVAAVFDFGSLAQAAVPGLTAGLAVCLTIAAIAFIERTGWPLRIRATIVPSSEQQTIAQRKVDKPH